MVIKQFLMQSIHVWKKIVNGMINIIFLCIKNKIPVLFRIVQQRCSVKKVFLEISQN